MVVGFKSIMSSQFNQNQNLNEMSKTMDSPAERELRNERSSKQDLELSPKEYLDNKCSNNELLRTSSNSNNWWPNDAEEKLERQQRWSFGSDTSNEALENIQSRLCCSPVDEFDSTVSSETEDVIVNNTEEESETYDACINLSPASSPTFKNVTCNSNGQKQRKSHDVYTADDELIDYSKRYTTDSSGSMVETKIIGSHIQEQQQRRLVLNNVSRPVAQKKSVNARPKGYPFGDYAETDLDQPTDYSLRYAEEDTDEDEKEDTRFYCTEQPEEDIVKTYCTEGTPSNFSTATSMTDLSTLEDTREGDEAAYKPQFMRDRKQEIVEKSEKSSKDCRSRIRQKFATEDSKIPRQQHCDQETCDRKVEKLCTPPQSPAEVSSNCKESSKAVTSNVEENNYAQETPLMFSRSSSLDSLSEFDQASIQDDHSSVISDFSHRTSGAVSPSELPDSPTQTVPPSPRRLERNTCNCSNLQQQQQEHESARPHGTERGSAQSLRQKQVLQPKQHLSQPQPLPLPQTQIQRVPPIRPVSRNPTIAQAQNNGQLHSHAPLMQPRSTLNGQVPMVQHPQMNNRSALMQRPLPESRAPLKQRPQTDVRVPQSTINNRGPVVQRAQADRFINISTNPMAISSPREIQQQLPRSVAPERCISVFEDNLVRFKNESMPGRFSTTGSSLSSLTIDDEDDNVSVDNREIVNKIMSIRVRSSAEGMHQAPCRFTNSNNVDKQPRLNVSNGHSGHRSNGSSHIPVNKKDFHYVNVEDESHDYMTVYSNKELQNNRYRDSPQDQWYDKELKNETRKLANVNNRPSSKSPVRSRSNNNDVVYHVDKLEIPDLIVVDTLQTYCTENTPIFVSPYGSQANLSGLSSLSMSDDDGDFGGYGLIEDMRGLRSPNFDEFELSNSRADSSEELANILSDEDEDKNYEDEPSLVARRRIDVSPFDSQMNLNFSLLCIEEEDEEDEEEEKNNETDRSSRTESSIYEDDENDDCRRLSRRNSECLDDAVLEQCIQSGVSKVTRHSVDPKTVP